MIYPQNVLNRNKHLKLAKRIYPQNRDRSISFVEWLHMILEVQDNNSSKSAAKYGNANRAQESSDTVRKG